VAVSVTAPCFAVTVNAFDAPTVEVVIANFATTCPPITVTVAGTTTLAAEELFKATTTPAEEAAAVKCTVPVAPEPPFTEVGAIVTDFNSPPAAAGLIVRVAWWVVP
jgi:hypothetical protein